MAQLYEGLEPSLEEVPLERLRKIAFIDFEYLHRHKSYGKFLLNAFASTHIRSIATVVHDFIRGNFADIYRGYQQAQQKGQLGSGADAWSASWVYLGAFFTMLLLGEEELAGNIDQSQLEKLVNHVMGVFPTQTEANLTDNNNNNSNNR